MTALLLPKRIEVIARGLILRRDAVLVCRNVKHGYCYIPGGHVEPGEAPDLALSREFSEEAGLGDVLIGQCLLIEEMRFIQRGKPKHELSIVFHVELPNRMGDGCPEVKTQELGISFEWIKLSDLAGTNLLPETVGVWILGGVELDKTCWRSSQC